MAASVFGLKLMLRLDAGTYGRFQEMFLGFFSRNISRDWNISRKLTLFSNTINKNIFGADIFAIRNFCD